MRACGVWKREKGLGGERRVWGLELKRLTWFFCNWVTAEAGNEEEWFLYLDRVILVVGPSPICVFEPT